MAKRKRLSPADPGRPGPGVPAPGPAPAPSRAPIAHVARDAAEQAAFTEVARELGSARDEGRLIQRLPLAEIRTGHLVRDRISFDDDDMAALSDSLARRGQQVPIEVVALETGGYGLISGLRRVMALGALGAETVLALVRRPETSAAAYLAMVEENEIRAGISFYERARLAAEAARLGIHDSSAAAIAALFPGASPAKRSKIGSFVRVHEALGGHLGFPAAIPERLGLALAQALERPGFAEDLRARLDRAASPDAAAERAVLETALAALPGEGGQGGAARSRGAGGGARREIAPGLALAARSGRVVLSGAAVTPDLAQALEDWLRARAATGAGPDGPPEGAE